MKFYIVDAFTDVLFGGNPAGVVILEEGMQFPEDELMRKTAAELRYSETAFVSKISEKEFRIRYFTPAAEVDLCGHATIGTFSALLADGQVDANTVCLCRTNAGDLNIDINGNFVMMDMGNPVTLGKIEDKSALAELYSIMGIPCQTVSNPAQKEFCDVPSVLSPELISTGLPDIIMPVSSQEMLAGLAPDFDALSRLSQKYDVVGVHAFVLGNDGITAHCRNFAPLYAIDEEAATGTSNGALTYYLYKYGIIKEKSLNTMIQGEAMNRPSRILSKLITNAGAVNSATQSSDKNKTLNPIKIQVGGSGVVLASGRIHLF